MSQRIFFFVKVLVITVVISWTNFTSATLVNVIGANYNYDESSGLTWLDLTQTTNVSYNSMMGGWGGLLRSGWRYATTSDMNYLFSSNLASLETTAHVGYYKNPTDFYVASPIDSAGEISRLVSVLGSTDSITTAYGIYGASVPCSGGCTAHALAFLTINGVGIDGGSIDNYGANFFGNYLVSGYSHAPDMSSGVGYLTTPVHEPVTIAMLLAGLALMCGLKLRAKNKTAHLAG